MNSSLQEMSRAAVPLRKNVLQESNFRASPTDLLMTPCTAKLQAHKQKRFAKTKGKVLQFGATTSSRLAMPSEDRENEQPQQ